MGVWVVAACVLWRIGSAAFLMQHRRRQAQWTQYCCEIGRLFVTLACAHTWCIGGCTRFACAAMRCPLCRGRCTFVQCHGVPAAVCLSSCVSIVESRTIKGAAVSVPWPSWLAAGQCQPCALQLYACSCAVASTTSSIQLRLLRQRTAAVVTATCAWR